MVWEISWLLEILSTVSGALGLQTTFIPFKFLVPLYRRVSWLTRGDHLFASFWISGINTPTPPQPPHRDVKSNFLCRRICPPSPSQLSILRFTTYLTSLLWGLSGDIGIRCGIIRFIPSSLFPIFLSQSLINLKPGRRYALHSAKCLNYVDLSQPFASTSTSLIRRSS